MSNTTSNTWAKAVKSSDFMEIQLDNYTEFPPLARAANSKSSYNTVRSKESLSSVLFESAIDSVHASPDDVVNSHTFGEEEKTIAGERSDVITAEGAGHSGGGAEGRVGAGVRSHFENGVARDEFGVFKKGDIVKKVEGKRSAESLTGAIAQVLGGGKRACVQGGKIKGEEVRKCGGGGNVGGCGLKQDVGNKLSNKISGVMAMGEGRSGSGCCAEGVVCKVKPVKDVLQKKSTKIVSQKTRAMKKEEVLMQQQIAAEKKLRDRNRYAVFESEDDEEEFREEEKVFNNGCKPVAVKPSKIGAGSRGKIATTNRSMNRFAALEIDSSDGESVTKDNVSTTASSNMRQQNGRTRGKNAKKMRNKKQKVHTKMKSCGGNSATMGCAAYATTKHEEQDQAFIKNSDSSLKQQIFYTLLQKTPDIGSDSFCDGKEHAANPRPINDGTAEQVLQYLGVGRVEDQVVMDEVFEGAANVMSEEEEKILHSVKSEQDVNAVFNTGEVGGSEYTKKSNESDKTDAMVGSAAKTLQVNNKDSQNKATDVLQKSTDSLPDFGSDGKMKVADSSADDAMTAEVPLDYRGNCTERNDDSKGVRCREAGDKLDVDWGDNIWNNGCSKLDAGALGIQTAGGKFQNAVSSRLWLDAQMENLRKMTNPHRDRTETSATVDRLRSIVAAIEMVGSTDGEGKSGFRANAESDAGDKLIFEEGNAAGDKVLHSVADGSENFDIKGACSIRCGSGGSIKSIGNSRSDSEIALKEMGGVKNENQTGDLNQFQRSDLIGGDESMMNSAVDSVKMYAARRILDAESDSRSDNGSDSGTSPTVQDEMANALKAHQVYVQIQQIGGDSRGEKDESDNVNPLEFVCTRPGVGRTLKLANVEKEEAEVIVKVQTDGEKVSGNLVNLVGRNSTDDLGAVGEVIKLERNHENGCIVKAEKKEAIGAGVTRRRFVQARAAGDDEFPPKTKQAVMLELLGTNSKTTAGGCNSKITTITPADSEHIASKAPSKTVEDVAATKAIATGTLKFPEQKFSMPGLSQFTSTGMYSCKKTSTGSMGSRIFANASKQYPKQYQGKSHSFGESIKFCTGLENGRVLEYNKPKPPLIQNLMYPAQKPNVKIPVAEMKFSFNKLPIIKSALGMYQDGANIVGYKLKVVPGLVDGNDDESVDAQEKVSEVTLSHDGSADRRVGETQWTKVVPASPVY